MGTESEVLAQAIKATKGMLKFYLSRWNKLGIILAHFSWDEADFCQEFMIHLLSHNKGSTEGWRVRWLAGCHDFNDIGTLKSFKAWTKREMKSFVGRLYYREISRGGAEEVLIAGDDWAEETDVGGEVMKNVEIVDICKWLEKEATEREIFIFNYNLELVEAVWEDGRITNYPGGSVSKKTFYSHREAFFKKLKLIIGE